MLRIYEKRFISTLYGPGCERLVIIDRVVKIHCKLYNSGRKSTWTGKLKGKPDMCRGSGWLPVEGEQLQALQEWAEKTIKQGV